MRRAALTCSAAAGISKARWNIAPATRPTKPARPYGPTRLAASDGEAGTGTAADPFNRIENARRPNSTFGGLVQGCVPACPLANMQEFATSGGLVPFFPGVAGATNAAGQPTAGTSNFNSGGDGAYN